MTNTGTTAQQIEATHAEMVAQADIANDDRFSPAFRAMAARRAARLAAENLDRIYPQAAAPVNPTDLALLVGIFA